jgi:hypothetical protein
MSTPVTAADRLGDDAAHHITAGLLQYPPDPSTARPAWSVHGPTGIILASDRSHNREDTVLIKHYTRSGLASVVSVLTMTSLAGIVPTGQVDATKEHSLRSPTSETDNSNVEEAKAQTPRLQLQTDQTMEQSSKALEEAIKQTRKESR